eukprot:TRINITY_DN3602_c0_g2_i1.p1 TRINITY_DN3602_c0_g2~~TRINITY_DN3602_c0_g2_i1.p1  ORF type:complete len:1107 (-),score=169.43 TRINITY_DN3602_c0_g2_i1:100-3420(-)
MPKIHLGGIVATAPEPEASSNARARALLRSRSSGGILGYQAACRPRLEEDSDWRWSAATRKTAGDVLRADHRMNGCGVTTRPSVRRPTSTAAASTGVPPNRVNSPSLVRPTGEFIGGIRSPPYPRIQHTPSPKRHFSSNRGGRRRVAEAAARADEPSADVTLHPDFYIAATTNGAQRTDTDANASVTSAAKSALEVTIISGSPTQNEFQPRNWSSNLLGSPSSTSTCSDVYRLLEGIETLRLRSELSINDNSKYEGNSSALKTVADTNANFATAEVTKASSTKPSASSHGTVDASTATVAGIVTDSEAWQVYVAKVNKSNSIRCDRLGQLGDMWAEEIGALGEASVEFRVLQANIAASERRVGEMQSRSTAPEPGYRSAFEQAKHRLAADSSEAEVLQKDLGCRVEELMQIDQRYSSEFGAHSLLVANGWQIIATMQEQIRHFALANEELRREIARKRDARAEKLVASLSIAKTLAGVETITSVHGAPTTRPRTTIGTGPWVQRDGEDDGADTAKLASKVLSVGGSDASSPGTERIKDGGRAAKGGKLEEASMVPSSSKFKITIVHDNENEARVLFDGANDPSTIGEDLEDEGLENPTAKRSVSAGDHSKDEGERGLTMNKSAPSGNTLKDERGSDFKTTMRTHLKDEGVHVSTMTNQMPTGKRLKDQGVLGPKMNKTHLDSEGSHDPAMKRQSAAGNTSKINESQVPGNTLTDDKVRDLKAVETTDLEDEGVHDPPTHTSVVFGDKLKDEVVSDLTIIMGTHLKDEGVHDPTLTKRTATSKHLKGTGLHESKTNRPHLGKVRSHDSAIKRETVQGNTSKTNKSQAPGSKSKDDQVRDLKTVWTDLENEGVHDPAMNASLAVGDKLKDEVASDLATIMGTHLKDESVHPTMTKRTATGKHFKATGVDESKMNRPQLGKMRPHNTTMKRQAAEGNTSKINKSQTPGNKSEDDKVRVPKAVGRTDLEDEGVHDPVVNTSVALGGKLEGEGASDLATIMRNYLKDEGVHDSAMEGQVAPGDVLEISQSAATGSTLRDGKVRDPRTAATSLEDEGVHDLTMNKSASSGNELKDEGGCNPETSGKDLAEFVEEDPAFGKRVINWIDDYADR